MVICPFTWSGRLVYWVYLHLSGPVRLKLLGGCVNVWARHLGGRCLMTFSTLILPGRRSVKHFQGCPRSRRIYAHSSPVPGVRSGAFGNPGDKSLLVFKTVPPTYHFNCFVDMVKQDTLRGTKSSVKVQLGLCRKHVRKPVESIMDAEVLTRTGAGYGERSPERVTQRNRYRKRNWDTRVGAMELRIPKLRDGSYLYYWGQCCTWRTDSCDLSRLSCTLATLTSPIRHPRCFHFNDERFKYSASRHATSQLSAGLRSGRELP